MQSGASLVAGKFLLSCCAEITSRVFAQFSPEDFLGEATSLELLSCLFVFWFVPACILGFSVFVSKITQFLSSLFTLCRPSYVMAALLDSQVKRANFKPKKNELESVYFCQV